jgi:hypothetical protein
MKHFHAAIVAQKKLSVFHGEPRSMKAFARCPGNRPVVMPKRGEGCKLP